MFLDATRNEVSPTRLAELDLEVDIDLLLFDPTRDIEQ